MSHLYQSNHVCGTHGAGSARNTPPPAARGAPTPLAPRGACRTSSYDQYFSNQVLLIRTITATALQCDAQGLQDLLLHAVEAGDAAEVRRLLDEGACCNVPTRRDETASTRTRNVSPAYVATYKYVGEGVAWGAESLLCLTSY